MGELLTFVFKTGVVCMFCGHSKHVKNGVQHAIGTCVAGSFYANSAKIILRS